jgi:syntaxin 1B/2/3
VDRSNFLQHIEHVRAKFSEIDGVSTEIDSLTIHLQSVTSAKEFKTLHASFSAEIQKASQIIKTIKSQIDALEVSNNDFQARFTESRESESHFRKVTWAGFSNRLRSTLVTFNKSQTGFENVYNQRTGAAGMNADLTPSPDASPVAAIGKVFEEARSEEDAIRREDMRRLERSMQEIRDAFVQIAALVESQGEMLDCIEYSTVNAKNYAHQANVQLISARKKQRKSLFFKAMCVLILILLFAGLGVGIYKIIDKHT